MADSPFYPFLSAERWLSPLLGTAFYFAILTWLVISFSLGIQKRNQGNAGERLAILSAVLASLIGGFYGAKPGSTASIALFVTAHGLFLLLLLRFGLSPCPLSTPSRLVSFLVVMAIGVSTLLKLLNLEDWPALLNDYGGMTGVEVIRILEMGQLSSFFLKPEPFVYGGGHSLLHAPLLASLFSPFGYSVFAVRLAEVVGSIPVLIFLWLVLRRLFSPIDALAGTTLFAFSAEHLAQSRVGTFYSISQALALCILWLWMCLDSKPSHGRRLLFALLCATLLLPFGYGPIRCLYLFSGIMLLLFAMQRMNFAKHGKLLICSSVALLFLSVLLVATESPFKGFLGPSKVLATDSPIWFKSASQRVSNTIQPLTDINANLWTNVGKLFDDAYSVTALNQSEPLYAASFSFMLMLAIAGISLPKWRTVCAYCLVGILPMILTFPLVRRGIVVRPLLPMVIVLLVREYVRAFFATCSPRWIQRTTITLSAGALGLLPLHGVFLFMANNGPIGTSPSFGPMYAIDMVRKVEQLSTECSVVIINAANSTSKFRMMLADKVYKSPAPYPILFRTISLQSSLDGIYRPRLPTCFVILNEQYRAWTVPWLKEKIPQLQESAVKQAHSNIPAFWILRYTPPIPPDDRTRAFGKLRWVPAQFCAPPEKLVRARPRRVSPWRRPLWDKWRQKCRFSPYSFD